MFDVSAEIEIKVENRDAPGGHKTVRVQWPTDEQWLRYQSQLEYIERPAADGVGIESELSGTERAEEELFRAIVLSQEPELDLAERSEVLDRLQWQRLRKVEREGNEVVVRLGVPGTETVHRLAIPTAAEKKQYRNGLPAVRDLGRGKTVRSLSIAAPCKLYEALDRGAEGYVNGGVPPIHKYTAVSAMLRLTEEVVDDRDFF